jgi:hypothetical protein
VRSQPPLAANSDVHPHPPAVPERTLSPHQCAAIATCSTCTVLLTAKQGPYQRSTGRSCQVLLLAQAPLRARKQHAAAARRLNQHDKVFWRCMEAATGLEATTAESSCSTKERQCLC